MVKPNLKTSSKTIGIIGYGEIGRGLNKVYVEKGFDPLIKDLDRDGDLRNVDVLNICIPWSKSFVRDVKHYIHQLTPALTIIHSTVPPGTTENISVEYPNVVHSPIRGIHPDLDKGIKTFIKVFGGCGAEKAAEHYEQDLHVTSCVYSSSRATEVAKLLDTSYYGVCIAWHDYVRQLCEQNGVSFEEAQSHYNITYNEGYQELGKPNVVRPTLTPPEGKIGGHCVVPNAELLREELDSKLLQAITDLK